MEVVDGAAFVSPVATANVANSAIASVGEQIIQGNSIRLFQDPTELTHQNTNVHEIGTVELLGLEGNVVGTGVIDGNIKCNMELNAMKLCPSKVAVRGRIIRPMCRPCHTLEESIATNCRRKTG